MEVDGPGSEALGEAVKAGPEGVGQEAAATAAVPAAVAPAVPTRKMKRKPRKEHLPDYLPEDRARAVVDAARAEPRVWVALRLMYGGLLRVSEVTKLRVRDCNLGAGSLRILRSKGGDRYVWLDDELCGALSAYLAEMGPDDFVADRGDGRPFSRFQLHRRVRECARMAGLDERALGFRMHCHVLRHSGAREYLRQGILNIEDVRVMLGHRDLSTTTIYLKTLGEQIRDKLKSRGGLKVA